jgi:hypothetical protein
MNQLSCDDTAVEFFVWPVIVSPGRVVHYLFDGEPKMNLFVPKDHLSTMDGLKVDIAFVKGVETVLNYILD